MKNYPAKAKTLRLMPLGRVIRGNVFKLSKKSKVAVVMDGKGQLRAFVFDSRALLDMLSTIDEALVDRLSGDDYYNKSINPAGWMIDKIESKMPVNPDFVRSVRKASQDAKKNGWISLESIVRKFGSI